MFDFVLKLSILVNLLKNIMFCVNVLCKLHKLNCAKIRKTYDEFHAQNLRENYANFVHKAHYKLGYKDIGIRNSELVARTQFLWNSLLRWIGWWWIQILKIWNIHIIIRQFGADNLNKKINLLNLLQMVKFATAY